MRSALLLLLAFSGSCRIFSPALPCGDDAGCESDERCVDGLCALRASLEGEGEGDGEGEGPIAEGEGEGEAAVGEGEGEAPVGEGEGEAAVGEGEGEAPAGEGEGEAPAGEGEGEGEAPVGEGEGEPVDPCPPLVDEQFNNGAGYFSRTLTDAGTSVSFDGGVITLGSVARAGVDDGFANVEGPLENFQGKVIEAEVFIPSQQQDGDNVGIHVIGTDVDIILDVINAELNFFAGDAARGIFDLRGSAFAPGNFIMQIRFDGPNPAAIVNGARAVLTGASSSVVNPASLRLFGGCFQACDGTSISIARVRIFPSCRP